MMKEQLRQIGPKGQIRSRLSPSRFMIATNVIVRERGRSSIPEIPMIEPRSSGVLDHPHARVMTALYVSAPSASLRGALATKQSILFPCGKMDCFASLAMTNQVIETESKSSLVRIPRG